MVFNSFQYWQEPHNGNTHWIHEDGSNPFCTGWGQTLLQKLPLSLSSVLETRSYQSSGHSSINTGRLESHSSLHQTYWMWVLGRPLGFYLGVTQMYQPCCAWAVGWCWPQEQAYGDTSGLARGQQQDSPEVLCSSWSQHSAKLIRTKCNETKRSQTRELECFGIKHFQIFPKHIQTTKLYQLEFQVLVARSEIKI